MAYTREGRLDVAENCTPAMPDANRSSQLGNLKKGNTVEATTKGVASFTLLLSPQTFDFEKPVKVIVNGRTTFDRRVQRSLRTLLKWAAIDDDREMLFGAQIKVNVSNKRSSTNSAQSEALKGALPNSLRPLSSLV
jgi:hypothetical protein